MTYTFPAVATQDYDLNTLVVHNVANYVHPIISSFSHQGFWNEFYTKNVSKNQRELLELIVDISRANFGPKIDNWPGVEVTIRGTINGNADQDVKIVLEKGKTKVASFSRVKKSTYSWTSACLATAGLFHEIHHSNSEGLTACQTIFGNSNGYTQFCSTLKGWDNSAQNSAEVAFSAAITAAGCKKRPTEIDAKIKAAAQSTIAKRSDDNCALGIRNVIRILTKVALVPADNPTK